MEIKTKIKEYLNYNLLYLSKPQNSIQSYKYDLQKFSNFCEKNKINYLNIKIEECNYFVTYLGRDLKLSAKSTNRVIATIRSFYKYLIKMSLIEFNIWRDIKSLKIEKNLPDFLSLEEVLKIIDVKTSDKNEHRDKLVIGLMFFGGLRISEVVNIKYENIFLEDKYMIITGKNETQRYVFIVDNLKILLNNYYNVQNKNMKKLNNWLITNNRSEKISRQSLWSIVIKKSSIFEQKITPHIFRHSFATYLLQQGLSQYEIKELLGHKSITTTQIYVHVTNEKLKNSVLTKLNEINKEIKKENEGE